MAFEGFTPGRGMTPAQAQFLANWKANMLAEQTAAAGETNAPVEYTGSYRIPGTNLVATPFSGGSGWQVYEGGDAMDSHDKSVLNGRMSYAYDNYGNLVNQGTIKNVSRTREFGPLMQAGSILAAPFAVGAAQGAGLMGGANPVLAAEGVGGSMAPAAAGVTVGGPMSTGLPAGTELGTLGAGGTAAMGAGAAGAAGAGGAGAAGAAGALSGGFDWGRLIGPGLSAAGGIYTAGQAKDAAGDQVQAVREAQAKMEPWYQAGGNALTRLQELLGIGGNAGAADYGKEARDFGMADFQADPGYQFRLDQGNRALTRAAAASGGLGSGRYLKDAMSYNQGQAAQEYGNAFNRYYTMRQNKLNPLQSLAGQGQSAAGTIADYSTQAGNASAAGKVGAANALTGAIGQGWSMYQNDRQMDQNDALYNALLRR